MIKLASLLIMSGILIAMPVHAQNVNEPDWRAILKQKLPVLGHRNFIVIADSAYPLQSNPGIETIYTGDKQINVVKEVIAAIERAAHVSGTIYLDQELDYVPENNAPGINAYRASLDAAIGQRAVMRLPHIDIIKKLDESSDLFNVLILKTDLILPYTSVFIELGAGYWNDQSEAELRKNMK